MKKILVLAIATVSMLVVSCKKDNETQIETKKNTPVLIQDRTKPDMPWE